MIAAVLLAGGEARRLGQPKGLVRVQGERLLDLQLRRLSAAGIQDVALVLGRNRADYVAIWPELVNAIARIGDATIYVVDDARSSHGPFGSLVAGIDALAEVAYERLAVLPIDVPCAAPDTITRLGNMSAEAVVPRFNGRGGHPVLLAPSLVARLRLLDVTTSRLDEQLRALPAGARRDVQVTDADILVDLNTMAAIAAHEEGQPT